jgi:hypothetical protein
MVRESNGRPRGQLTGQEEGVGLNETPNNSVGTHGFAMKTCTYCGRENDDTSGTCQGCGVEFSAGAPVHPVAASRIPQFVRHDLMLGWRDKFRVIACILVFPAMPGFLLCGQHFCKCGHLAHGPYPVWYSPSDHFWIFGFCGAAILSICSSHPWRILFASLLTGLTFHRLLLNSVFGFVVDLPILFAVGWLASRGPGRKHTRDEGQPQLHAL